MTPSNSLSVLTSYLLPSLPAVIVWLVGVIQALTTWRRHPRVSQTVLIACVLLLVNAAVGPVAQYWLFYRAYGPAGSTWYGAGRSFQQIELLAGLLTLVRVAFSTVGYVLLLFAIFGWRATPRFPAGPPTEPFGERTAVRPANLPGGETAIRPDQPRP
jgi:hypothetical protein